MLSAHRLLAFVLFFAGISLIQAQNGFVVTLKGDTLKGRVIMQPQATIDQLMVKGRKKIHLTARDVRNVNIGTITYRPVVFEGRMRFMKIVRQGYLSLLSFQSSYQSFAFDGSLLMKADGSMMEVPRISFRKDLPTFIDQPALADSISQGHLTLSNILEIVDRYNRNVERLTRSAAAVNKAISQNMPSIQLLDSLRKEVETSNCKNTIEPLEIITDLRAKLASGQHAPGYAVNALNESLKACPGVAGLLAETLSSLRKN